MDNIFRIAVCDDNASERVFLIDKIKEYMTKHFEGEQTPVIDEYDNGASMLENISNKGKNYNLLFQDIEMDNMNGIEVVQRIKSLIQDIHVIYVSAHNGYIFETYKTDPLNYLIKPVVIHQLYDVLDEVKRRIIEANNFYTIETSSYKIKIYYNDILYFERIGHSISLFTESGKEYEIYKSVKKLTSELNHESFIQINQGCLVNFKKIYSLEKDVIVLTNGESLPVSRRLKTKVRKEFFEKVR